MPLLNKSNTLDTGARSSRPKISCMQSAMNSLARREHSRLDLEHKLLSKGFTLEEISQVLDNLSQRNLQNDQRFVENYVHMRTNRGFGPLLIKAELHEYGIAKDIIIDAINEKDSFWFECAQKTYQKKFGNKSCENLSFAIKAKRMRFLQTKGFTFEQIRKIIGELED